MSDNPTAVAYDPAVLHLLVQQIVKEALTAQAQDKQLLDRHALAERLGVSARLVGNLVATKELPEPLRLGGLVRWDWTEVLKFLSATRSRRPRKGRGRYPRQPADETAAPARASTRPDEASATEV